MRKKKKQDEFNEVVNALSRYSPRDKKYIGAKNKFFDNAKNFYKGRDKIIEGFKNGILPLSKKDDMKTDSGHQQPDVLDTPEEIKFNDFLKHIKEEQKNIGMRLSEETFAYKTLDKMLQTLHNLKWVDSYNQEAYSTENNFEKFWNKDIKTPEGVNKNKRNIQHCK